DDIARPSVAAVGVALIAGVVPRQTLGPLVLLRDHEWTVLPKVLARCEAAEARAHLFRAALQNASHHHARPRGDGRTAVGHFAGVGGVHLDIVVGQTESVGTNPRMHRPRALADLRA